MEYKKAFQISYYSTIDNETISLKGRVVSDISIGDTLTLLDYNTTIQYVVKKIVAYKHDFDIINSGMTCELVVIGENKGFKEEELLHLKEKY